MGLGWKEKNKFTFLKVFVNPLSKYLISKIFFCLQWLFWVVYQNKKGRLGLAFGAHFLQDFSINTISMAKVST